ncbi:recombinase family protein [Streptomyces turgidiscabies]|uniref:Resolvase, N-terminal domain protein n=1 Tax=Streptomyces turgidiscabies (strain Car8) TaxID=698760 RepID=L7FFL5_STRT8|nr:MULTISPECIES: recombinase family protein [Streptomyces]ELP69480.1 resolvase, N-terminal domain protein [Streptomyces turgidiscabies Car8]MDX3493480.1 recombinase family protein [Streptomyces turgidiscabies]GAQ70786.1 recombinase [Streptomyces turgidiscabies]
MPGTSRSYLNPDLVKALSEGQTFEQWLGDRTPGIDYARISGDQAARSSRTAKTREKGVGIRHQHEGNDEVAAEHGIAIVRFYEDNDITAADPDILRPSFREMTRAILHRKVPEGFPVRAIVATEYERVWRLPEDYIRFRRAVISEPDGVFVERGKVFDIHSVEGNIVGLVNSGVSEGEVSKTRERILRNMRRRAQDGTTPGGRRRFGWLAQDPREGRPTNMVLSPDEAPYVRKMIDWALEGRAWKTIARDLNELGSVGASGKPWSGETVRQLLVNPVICGMRQMKGEIVKNARTGEPVMGKWETIATVEEWEAIRDLSKRRGSQRGMRLTNGGGKVPGTPESRARKYLFSGFLRCGAPRKDGKGICNAKMGGMRRPTRSNPDNCTYTCVSLDCGKTARSLQKVDEFLEEIMIRALEAEFKHAEVEKTPWEGEERLAALKTKKDSLESKWMEGVVSDDQLYRLTPQLEEQIEALEEDRREHAAMEVAKNTFSGWDRSKWAGMDLTQKRLAIGRIMDAAIILPIPEGRSKRAPFDADLIKVIHRESGSQQVRSHAHE